QKVGSTNSRHYGSGQHRSNPFEEEENNNAHKRNIKKMGTYTRGEKKIKPIHDEDKLIQDLRREQRMRMLHLQKQHGWIRSHQKKMASCFFTYRRRKTKDGDLTHEPLERGPQVEEPKAQRGSPRKRRLFKCLSEPEFGNSDDLLPGKGNQKANEASKRRAERAERADRETGRIPIDDSFLNSASYHRDVGYHSDTRCNRKISHDIGPYSKKAKRQLKKRVHVEMTPEKFYNPDYFTNMYAKLKSPLVQFFDESLLLQFDPQAD
ncbi:hypothetical protein PCYB_083930, partial [Plasmodium cynomolgi strain B]